MLIDRPDAPLELDELVAFWIADPAGPGTLWQRSLDVAATPPMFSCLEQPALTGNHEPWKFRLPSWIAFALAVGLVFAAGRQIGGELVGGIAALVLSLHPESLDLMRLARPYAFSTFFAAVNLYALIGAYRRQPTIFRWGLLILSQAALVWTHYLNVPFVVVEGVLLFFAPHVLRSTETRNLPSIGRSMVFVTTTVAAALTLPLLPSVLRMLDLSPFLNYRADRLPLSEIVHPFWWVAVPVGLAAAIAVSRNDGDNPQHVSKSNLTGLLLLSLGPVLLLAAAGFWFQPSLAEVRYRTVCAPASSLLLACLVGRSGRVLPALLAVSVGVALAWWFSGRLPWRSERLGTPAAQNWAEMAAEIDAKGTADEPIFVYSGLIESRLVPAATGDPLLMDYVACRLGRFRVRQPHPRIALPWAWTTEPALMDYYAQQFAAARKTGRAVWLAAATDTDLGRAAAAHLTTLAAQEDFAKVSETRLPKSVLIRFEFAHEPPPQ